MPDIVAFVRDTSIGAKTSNGSTWSSSDISQTWKFINGNATQFCYGVIDERYPTSPIINSSTNSGTNWASGILPHNSPTIIVALYPGATSLSFSYDGSVFV